jgi:DNA mismatch endonuclease (patch repair protein)
VEAPRYLRGASQRSEGTGPELRVQRAARALGLTFRANVKELPGSPDLVFDALKTALFVNGCFWHSHPGCPGQRIRFPEDGAKRAFWHEKLIRNVLRDERVASELEALGWRVVVLWDCQTRPRATLLAALAALKRAV